MLVNQNQETFLAQSDLKDLDIDLRNGDVILATSKNPTPTPRREATSAIGLQRAYKASVYGGGSH